MVRAGPLGLPVHALAELQHDGLPVGRFPSGGEITGEFARVRVRESQELRLSPAEHPQDLAGNALAGVGGIEDDCRDIHDCAAVDGRLVEAGDWGLLLGFCFFLPCWPGPVRIGIGLFFRLLRLLLRLGLLLLLGLLLVRLGLCNGGYGWRIVLVVPTPDEREARCPDTCAAASLEQAAS